MKTPLSPAFHLMKCQERITYLKTVILFLSDQMGTKNLLGAVFWSNSRTGLLPLVVSVFDLGKKLIV